MRIHGIRGDPSHRIQCEEISQSINLIWWHEYPKKKEETTSDTNDSYPNHRRRDRREQIRGLGESAINIDDSWTLPYPQYFDYWRVIDFLNLWIYSSLCVFLSLCLPVTPTISGMRRGWVHVESLTSSQRFFVSWFFYFVGTLTCFCIFLFLHFFTYFYFYIFFPYFSSHFFTIFVEKFGWNKRCASEYNWERFTTWWKTWGFGRKVWRVKRTVKIIL